MQFAESLLPEGDQKVNLTNLNKAVYCSCRYLAEFCSLHTDYFLLWCNVATLRCGGLFVTLGFSYWYITKGNSQIFQPGHFWPGQRSVWSRDDSIQQIRQKHSHFSIRNALISDCVAIKSIGICLSFTWHFYFFARMFHNKKGIISHM